VELERRTAVLLSVRLAQRSRAAEALGVRPLQGPANQVLQKAEIVSHGFAVHALLTRLSALSAGRRKVERPPTSAASCNKGAFRIENSDPTVMVGRAQQHRIEY
jgi:hypothetical protein